jgi:ATP-dependent Clp endopeptidase proteolytic subunit ClpP
MSDKPTTPTPAPDSPAAKLDLELKQIQVEQNRINLAKAKRDEVHNAAFQAADLRRINAVAETAEIDLAKKQRDVARELASPEEALTYTFYDGVTQESVKPCLAELSKWSRRFPGKPITIVVNSPGGDVIGGLALYDYSLKLRADGHHITIVVLGMAASMGGILLQIGDKRVVGRYSQVLIHEVASGTAGKISAQQDRLNFSKSLWEQLSEILAERSSLTAAQIRSRADRFDWWLTAQEAVELGFADEILAAPRYAKVKKNGNKKTTSSELAKKAGKGGKISK